MFKLFSIFIFSFFPFFTFAQTASSNVAVTDSCANYNTGLVPCGLTECPCNLCHFLVLFSRIVDFLIKPPNLDNMNNGLVYYVAALFVAIAGMMFVYAYINPESGAGTINKAKSLLISVVVGILIIFTAWIVVSFFFQAMGVQTWTGLLQWNTVNCNGT